MTGAGWLIVALFFVIAALALALIRTIEQFNRVQRANLFLQKWRKRASKNVSHIMQAERELTRWLEQTLPTAVAAAKTLGMCPIHLALEALKTWKLAEAKYIEQIKDQQQKYESELLTMRRDRELEWNKFHKERDEHFYTKGLVGNYLELLKKPKQRLSMKQLTERKKMRDELRQQIEQRLAAKDPIPTANACNEKLQVYCPGEQGDDRVLAVGRA